MNDPFVNRAYFAQLDRLVSALEELKETGRMSEDTLSLLRSGGAFLERHSSLDKSEEGL